MRKQAVDKQLPDTPWHLGYAKKKEDDPRRHKARCIYYYKTNKTCECTKSPCYLFNCGGSAHCKYYKEIGIVAPKKNGTTKTSSKYINTNEYRKQQKKQYINRLVVKKNNKNNCPFCGKSNNEDKTIIVIDSDGCTQRIKVKKCECGTIYLTMRLKNKLPPTIRCEVYKDAISLKRSGIKIISNEPVDNPIAKMIVCPKCKSKCTSLFENKGMCLKCYKKNYNV